VPSNGVYVYAGGCAAAGVIDQDYRGNVGVVMFNFGQEAFKGMWMKVNHCSVGASVQVCLKLSRGQSVSEVANHYDLGLMITILGRILRHYAKICQIRILSDSLLIV
jgi:hypothetical protein